MKTKQINLYDCTLVEFLQNNKNGLPVCRINGKISFIRMDKNMGANIPKVGELWTVSLVEENERFNIVSPLFFEVSKAENEAQKQAQIKELFSIKKEKKIKPKKAYQYLSKNEILKGN